MADNPTNFWAALVAGIPGLGALGWAIYRTVEDKHQSHNIIVTTEKEENSVESARASLDSAQKEWFDRMRIDIQDKRNRIAELEAKCGLWEARARRADMLCYQLRQILLDNKIKQSEIPRIPLLEEHINNELRASLGSDGITSSGG